MDMDKIAGVVAPVDEQSVEHELAVRLGDWHQVEPPREPWRITSLGAADWAMRRLWDAQNAVQRYDDEISLWRRARGRVQAAVEFFEERLSEWGAAERTDARKSFALAHGTVSTRAVKARVQVDDQAAVLEWARTHCPDAIEQIPATEKLHMADVSQIVIPGQVVVAWQATNRGTGEVERLPVDRPHTLDAEEQAIIVQAAPDGVDVEPVLADAVVDADGWPVPGLSVVPAKVSVTVKPLGI